MDLRRKVLSCLGPVFKTRVMLFCPLGAGEEEEDLALVLAEH